MKTTGVLVWLAVLLTPILSQAASAGYIPLGWSSPGAGFCPGVVTSALPKRPSFFDIGFLDVIGSATHKDFLQDSSQFFQDFETVLFYSNRRESVGVFAGFFKGVGRPQSGYDQGPPKGATKILVDNYFGIQQRLTKITGGRYRAVNHALEVTLSAFMQAVWTDLNAGLTTHERRMRLREHTAVAVRMMIEFTYSSNEAESPEYENEPWPTALRVSILQQALDRVIDSNERGDTRYPVLKSTLQLVQAPITRVRNNSLALAFPR